MEGVRSCGWGQQGEAGQALGRFKREPEPPKGVGTAMAYSLYFVWTDTAETVDNTCSRLHLAIPGHVPAEMQENVLSGGDAGCETPLQG